MKLRTFSGNINLLKQLIFCVHTGIKPIFLWIMSIHNIAVPCDDWIQYTFLLEDVHFQLVGFLKRRRVDLFLELRVNFKLAQFCHRQTILSEMK